MDLVQGENVLQSGFEIIIIRLILYTKSLQSIFKPSLGKRMCHYTDFWMFFVSWQRLPWHASLTNSYTGPENEWEISTQMYILSGWEYLVNWIFGYFETLHNSFSFISSILWLYYGCIWLCALVNMGLWY